MELVFLNLTAGGSTLTIRIRRSAHSLGVVALALALAACGVAPRAQAPVRAGAPAAQAAIEVDMDRFVGDAFARADVDRDGALSGRESGLDAAQFRALDRDASGAIERAEWGHGLPLDEAVAQLGPFRPMVDEVRRQLDADHDRAVTGAELRRFAARGDVRYEPLRAGALEAARRIGDLDANGRLEGAEFDRFYVALGGTTEDRRGLFSKIVNAALGGYLAVTSKLAFQKACHPGRKPVDQTPAKFGLPYEEVAFKTEDGLTIRGWFVPARVPTNHTVIAYHGIDDNRSCYVRQGQVAWLNPYVNQLLVDLRNQGESDGDRTTFGYHEGKDVQAAYRYLQGRGIDSAMVYGTSLGGATAIRGGALVPQLKGVVDDCTYATVQQAFTGFISLTFVPCPVLIAAATIERANREFGIDMRATEPVTQVARIAPRPLLIIHGAADRNIAPENSRLLFDAAGAGFDKELWFAPGASHAQSAVAQPQEYQRRLVGMVTRTFGIGGEPAPVPVPAPVVIPPGTIGG